MEETIKNILKKQGVSLGYLFGSQARGTAGPMSDIDVAVIFPYNLDEKNQAEKIENIRSKIQHEFNTNYVDVINLSQNNNPALCYNIVFGGKVLLAEDLDLKTRLELKVVRDYEDTKCLRSVQSIIIKNKFNVAFK
jgi:hypothetical protein